VIDSELEARLDRLEGMLAALLDRETAKEWYTTEEFARLVGKAEFTCREWCRHGRVRAEKRTSGRGAHPAWVISHAELLRYRREGLLPARRVNVCPTRPGGVTPAGPWPRAQPKTSATAFLCTSG
jgi:hypothetical protein